MKGVRYDMPAYQGQMPSVMTHGNLSIQGCSDGLCFRFFVKRGRCSAEKNCPFARAVEMRGKIPSVFIIDRKDLNAVGTGSVVAAVCRILSFHVGFSLSLSRCQFAFFRRRFRHRQ